MFDSKPETETAQNTPSKEVTTSFFKLPIEGNFPKDKIVVQDTQEIIKRPKEIEQQIERNWVKRQQEVKQRGGKLFDSQRVILLNTQVKDGKLNIKLGRGRYKDIVGTYGSEIQNSNPELVPRNFSVSILPETTDGYLILHKRNNTVFLSPDWISTFGGSVDPEDVDGSGNVDPFISVAREVSEEVGISSESIHDIKCLGFIRDTHTKVEDMMFLASISMTKEEIEKQQEGQSLEEGTSVFVPINAVEVRKKLLEFSKVFVSDGAAILALYGRREFGEEWFNFVISRLKRRGKVYESLTDKQREIIEQRLIKRLGRVKPSK